MELLFRKYFWAVNLAFLLCAAFLSAKTFNVFVEKAITPRVDQSSSKATSALPTLPSSAHKGSLTLEAVAKVTGIPLPKPEEIEESPQLPALDNQDPVKTSLRVRLLGTTVAFKKPEWSLANIEDTNARDATVYMIGDKIQNAEILEIERMRVIINNNGRKEYIDAEMGEGVANPIASLGPTRHGVGPANMPPHRSTIGSNIRAINENNYEIPRDEIDKALGNLNDIAMQARIVPAFKDGAATGFKVFSIRPNSLYSRIGIQNGDVVRRINGFEINSPEKALEIYSKLKESSHIEIEIDRNGTPVRKTYNVR